MLIHARKQEHTQRHQRRAGNRKSFVATPATDELPTGDRSEKQTEDHRQQSQTRIRGGSAIHDLEKERQIGCRAKEREPDHKSNRTGQREHRIAEELERHDRFGGVLFCNDKANDENSPGNGQENNRRGSPWIDAPAKGGEQDQAAGRGSQQNSTQVINGVLTSLACGGQGNGDHE